MIGSYMNFGEIWIYIVENIWLRDLIWEIFVDMKLVLDVLVRNR